MGATYCTCKVRPCACYSGWGSHFEDLDELLEEIDREIRAEEIRLDVPSPPRPRSPEVPDGFTVVKVFL